MEVHLVLNPHLNPNKNRSMTSRDEATAHDFHHHLARPGPDPSLHRQGSLFHEYNLLLDSHLSRVSGIVVLKLSKPSSTNYYFISNLLSCAAGILISLSNLLFVK